MADGNGKLNRKSRECKPRIDQAWKYRHFKQGSDNLDHQTNTTTNVTVPLRVEFNSNRETETNKNERITKTNGRSMKHRDADNGIISTFVKLSFLSLSVMRQI